jgi:hypothetical protein
MGGQVRRLGPGAHAARGGAKPIGEGTIVITNKRLILKTGNRTARSSTVRRADLPVQRRPALQKTIGSTLLKFKSGRRRPGNRAELLSALDAHGRIITSAHDTRRLRRFCGAPRGFALPAPCGGSFAVA